MSDKPTVPAAGANERAGPRLPEAIGPVRLIRQIGSGGMGVVWLAHHDLLAREVAVKFLVQAEKAVSFGSGLDAFIRGAQAAASLRHPGLTAIYDAGVVEGVPYIVMEYVDGTSVADVLRSKGTLALPVLRTVMAEVCAGLAELHDRDVVHRDIKPSNILIGRDGALMVTDFGLTCERPFVRGDAAEPTRVAGTPYYMAPEMFKGDVSPQSDVYAIGATTLELMVGAFPYRWMADVGSRPEVLEGILSCCSAPPPLIAAIRQAMHKERRFRPRSARRIGQLIEQAFAESNVAAAPRNSVRHLAFSASPQDGPPSVLDNQQRTPQLISALAEQKRQRRDPASGSRKSIRARNSPLRAALRIHLGPFLATAFLGSVLMGLLLVTVFWLFDAPLYHRQLGEWLHLLSWPRHELRHDLALVMQLLATIAIATVLMIALYDTHDHTNRTGEPGRVCGWCGHRGLGLWSERCPECGRDIFERGARLDRPPAKQALRIAKSLTLSIMATAITLALSWQLSCLGISLACVVGLLVYQVTSHSAMLLDGVVRCGACGAPIAFAGQSSCTKCSTEL